MTEKLSDLLKIERIKTYHYRAFQVLTIAYIVMLVLIFIGAQRFINNITVQSNDTSFNPFRGLSFYYPAYIWQNFTYVAGYLKIVPALLVILLVTNEFSFITLRQQLISGMSRLGFLFGKLMIVVFITLGVVVLIGVSAFILGKLHQKADDVSMINSGLWFLPAHALELLTYLTFAMLVAFLFKRSGIATIVFILYSLIGERIIKLLMPGNLGDYLPLNAAGSLVPLPNNTLTTSMGLNFNSTVELSLVAACLVYCVLFTAIIYVLLNRRDA